MKELLILRHGKSDWHAGASSDHERPLNERGKKAAAAVGRFLTATGQQPDLVLSSPALRARTTAERAHRAGDWSCAMNLDESLYGAAVTDVLAAAGSCSNAVERLLIAGHEPTSSAVVHHLTGAQVRFPTAGLACIGLAIDDWAELQGSPSRGLRGELLWFIIPRLLV
jgi:phosphohistidine phosphatase